MSLKIHIHDRIYSSWDIYNINDNSLSTVSINPIIHKLLSGDIIDETGQLIDSHIRNTKSLAGILILNKTYGRCQKNNGTSGKLYYKCIPNDKHIPEFLIPYEEKNIGFNKAHINKFILFKFSHWNDKHPVGTLNNVIGDVTDMSSFYEYQLQCKDLVKSIKKFTSDAHNSYKLLGATLVPNCSISYISHYNLQDRRSEYIISVDPQDSTDLDDAFSIKNNVISIYIANVPILLDHLKLWGSFSERISTIYLPDRKCAMLPPLLSEHLCSLLENQERGALCLDVEFSLEDASILSINLLPVVIKVSKNYVYNEDKLLNDKCYKQVHAAVLVMNKKQKYMREICDSHDVVAYLMLLINAKCADILNDHETGIFRIINIKEPLKEEQPGSGPGSGSMPAETYNLIKLWQTSCGQYTSHKNNIGHQLINSGIGVSNYAHISSPIRRLVDLLNMLKIQSKLNIKLSNEALVFYEYWENQLTYINTTMRSIRKIQTDCNLLNLCVTNSLVLEEIYEGYLFDKIIRPNKLFQYTVYIPKIKMFSRINMYEEYPDYAGGKFKLYLIQDGTTFKQKIKAAKVE